MFDSHPSSGRWSFTVRHHPCPRFFPQRCHGKTQREDQASSTMNTYHGIGSCHIHRILAEFHSIHFSEPWSQPSKKGGKQELVNSFIHILFWTEKKRFRYEIVGSFLSAFWSMPKIKTTMERWKKRRTPTMSVWKPVTRGLHCCGQNILHATQMGCKTTKFACFHGNTANKGFCSM